jgi:hypothetical protein
LHDARRHRRGAFTEEEDWSSRDAKLAVSSAIVDGDLEEHPQFEGHYRHA